MEACFDMSDPNLMEETGEGGRKRRNHVAMYQNEIRPFGQQHWAEIIENVRSESGE